MSGQYFITNKLGATVAVLKLLDISTRFELDPLPDDNYGIKVRDEHRPMSEMRRIVEAFPMNKPEPPIDGYYDDDVEEVQ